MAAARLLVPVITSLVLASCSTGGNNVRHEEGFAVVNGVRLHYIDWGGKGEYIVAFLDAMGVNQAHIAVVGKRIQQFESGVARGESLLLRNTTHAGFVADPVQQKVFVPIMREFLLRR